MRWKEPRMNGRMEAKTMKRSIWASLLFASVLAFALVCGCGQTEQKTDASQTSAEVGGFEEVADASLDTSKLDTSPSAADTSGAERKKNALPDIEITEDMREGLDHGEKGAKYQKYIVLHDTEGEGEPSGVIEYWDGTDTYVGAHFVIGKDGSIWQCVPMDRIAHHAGYGDAGHNELYEIEEDGRDDMRGTSPIGDWAPDYGMNAWSIGIEMIHVGGSGSYPEEQLDALDNLIAYIDAYYGGDAGKIIDHKAWRSGNSDTSPEFADYLANYQDHRTHD